jgi:hypothetical protein
VTQLVMDHAIAPGAPPAQSYAWLIDDILVLVPAKHTIPKHTIELITAIASDVDDFDVASLAIASDVDDFDVPDELSRSPTLETLRSPVRPSGPDVDGEITGALNAASCGRNAPDMIMISARTAVSYGEAAAKPSGSRESQIAKGRKTKIAQGLTKSLTGALAHIDKDHSYHSIIAALMLIFGVSLLISTIRVHLDREVPRVFAPATREPGQRGCLEYLLLHQNEPHLVVADGIAAPCLL